MLRSHSIFPRGPTKSTGVTVRSALASISIGVVVDKRAAGVRLVGEQCWYVEEYGGFASSSMKLLQRSGLEYIL